MAGKSIVREEVVFPCGQDECHGIIYRPAGASGLPGLVMGMGFGMVKDAHADTYGPVLAGEGLAVLAFDYRRFGRSGGTPRQALYPDDQVADYRCALAYLQSQPYVDGEKMCVWGTSYSGGHVLTLLAFPTHNVKCGVAQVPSFYSYKSALKLLGSLEPVLSAVSDGISGACGGSPEYVPIVSRDGQGLLTSDEAINYYLKVAETVPSFENRITADSLPRILAYNPGYYAELVTRPLMVVLALRDRTVPVEDARIVASRVRGPVELVEVDSGHFDIYEEPLASELARREARWILETLGYPNENAQG